MRELTAPYFGTWRDTQVLADLRIKVLKLSRRHLLMLATLRQSSFGQSETHRTILNRRPERCGFLPACS
jgi:hypothetical protein